MSEIRDKWEIRELSARFNHAVDKASEPMTDEQRRRTTEEFCDTFVEDGVLEVPGRASQRGHGEIAAWTRDREFEWVKGLSSPMGRTIHSSTDHLIEVTGDEATQVSYVMVYRQVSPDRLPNGLLMVTERFEDRLVRTTRGWRFTHRRMEIVHANVDPRSLTET